MLAKGILLVRHLGRVATDCLLANSNDPVFVRVRHADEIPSRERHLGGRSEAYRFRDETDACCRHDPACPNSRIV